MVLNQQRAYFSGGGKAPTTNNPLKNPTDCPFINHYSCESPMKSFVSNQNLRATTATTATTATAATPSSTTSSMLRLGTKEMGDGAAVNRTRPERSGGDGESHGKAMGKPWESHGISMGYVMTSMMDVIFYVFFLVFECDFEYQRGNVDVR